MRQGDELLHYFTHHISKTEDELREILHDKMIQHLPWLQQVSKVVLKDVNVSIEDYIDTVTMPGVPLDFVALLALSRFYHIHVAVFTTKGMWLTSRKTKENDCIFSVVYHGNFSFSETVSQGNGDQYREWIAEHARQGRMPSHQRNCIPGAVKIKTNLEHLSDALNIVNNNVLCKHVSSSKDCSEKVCKIKEEYEIPNYAKAISNVLVKWKTEDTVKDEPLHQDSDEIADDSSTNSCEILQCDETLLYSDHEQQVNSKIDLLWNSVESNVQLAQSAVDGDTVHNDATVEPEEIEISDDLLLTCPMCLHMETTQKACVKHIADFHPEYRFKCSFYGKDCPSFGARYRHEKEHQDPKHHCQVCGQGFPFKSEMERHSGVHLAVLLFGSDKCEKRFAQVKSLNRHKTVHNNESHPCEECGKVCGTSDKLYTHFRGAHGKGYDAKCGVHYQWPGTRARHQNSCTNCQVIIAQELAIKKRKSDTVSNLEKKVKVETVSGPKKNVKVETVLAPRKNVKVEGDSIKDTKEKIALKLETIMEMKKDLM